MCHLTPRISGQTQRQAGRNRHTGPEHEATVGVLRDRAGGWRARGQKKRHTPMCAEEGREREPQGRGDEVRTRSMKISFQ